MPRKLIALPTAMTAFALIATLDATSAAAAPRVAAERENPYTLISPR